MKPVDFEIC